MIGVWRFGQVIFLLLHGNVKAVFPSENFETDYQSVRSHKAEDHNMIWTIWSNKGLYFIATQQAIWFCSCALLRWISGLIIANVSNERIASISKCQRVHEGVTFFRKVEHQLPYMSLFFWVLTLNIWVSNRRRFEWTHRLYLQASKSPWRWYFLPKRRPSRTLLL
jgi:hypothetical protein